MLAKFNSPTFQGIVSLRALYQKKQFKTVFALLDNSSLHEIGDFLVGSAFYIDVVSPDITAAMIAILP